MGFTSRVLVRGRLKDTRVIVPDEACLGWISFRFHFFHSGFGIFSKVKPVRHSSLLSRGGEGEEIKDGPGR